MKYLPIWSAMLRLRSLVKQSLVVYLSTFLVFAPGVSLANNLPKSPTVVHGDIRMQQSGASLSVQQQTSNGIINWQSFDVGAGHSVHFNNGAGATLNRVTGINTSHINGSLSATGSLFLINQNGIIVGENGQILTGGHFVASTLDITDADFLDGGGFTLAGNSTLGVTNLGQISSLGGDIFLAGFTVTNEGTLSAPEGRVGLAAGQVVDVLADASWLGGAYAVSLGVRDNEITNEGRIEALVAELRTHNGNIYALAGNNDGLIHATGVSNEGGRVFLTAEEGVVQSSGTIIAENGENGGVIEIDAARVDNYGGLQDVSGAEGGEILINAGAIASDTEMRADGASGAGGRIAIEATNEVLLTSAGLISAEGATEGGSVVIDSNAGALIHSATIEAKGGATGGEVALLGDDIVLLGGDVDASGANQGGSVYVGGGYQGGEIDPELAGEYSNAQRVYQSDKSIIRGDATVQGDGGEIILWADGTTQFLGELTTREGPQGGQGGLIETSGLAALGGDGTVDAGQGGTWLQDPRDIIIDDVTDPITEFQRVVGVPGGQKTDRNVAVEFGGDLDVDGDTIVIGSNLSSPRVAWVYENGLIAARITHPDSPMGFGETVAVEGDLVALISQEINPLSRFNIRSQQKGAIHVYWKGDGWQNGSTNLLSTAYTPLSTDSIAFEQTGFGSDIQGFTSDLTGQTGFVVSSPLYENTSIGASGAFHFFTLPNNFNPNSPFIGTQTVGGNIANLQLGREMAVSDEFIAVTIPLTNEIKVAPIWNPFHLTEAASTRTISLDTGVLRDFAASGNELAVLNSSSNRVAIYDVQTTLINGNSFGGMTFNETSEFALTGAQADRFDTFDFSGDAFIGGYSGFLSLRGAASIFQEPAGGWGTANGGQVNSVLNLVGSVNTNNAAFSGQLGWEVAIEGDTAVIGSPRYGNSSSPESRQGRVTVITRGATGDWLNDREVNYLEPAQQLPKTATNTNFGTIVAMDDDTVVVADRIQKVQSVFNQNDYSGALYFYEGGELAAVWGGRNNFVGIPEGALDLHNGLLGIGFSSGSTLFYERGAGWQNGSLTAANTNFFAGAGVNLEYFDIQDDIIVGVQNPGDSELRIFENTSNDWFTTLQNNPGEILNLPTGFRVAFGQSVAARGDTIAVIGNQDDGPTADERGKVLVYENTGNDWQTASLAELTRSGSAADDGLDLVSVVSGASIDIEEDIIAVALGGESSAYAGPGRGVYLYEREDSWLNATSPVARLSMPEAGFGHRVDLDGPNALAISETFDTVRFGGDGIHVFRKGGNWLDGSANFVGTLATTDGVGLQGDFAFHNGLIVAGGEDLLAASFNESASFFNAPLALDSRFSFSNNDSSDYNIAASAVAGALSTGTNITLQARRDLFVRSPIIANNPFGDGGDLTLEGGGDIIINDDITTDNGDLTLITNHPLGWRDANAVVVLGRDESNQGVTLDLGTGTLLVNAAGRFENRTGSSSPFAFDATTPGRFLIFERTPDDSSAPDAQNLGLDVDIVGRDFMAYNRSFDFDDYLPTDLPTGSGFFYTVQPDVSVSVGSDTITYGGTPNTALTVDSVTVAGNPVDASVFGITSQSAASLVQTGLANTVSTSNGGFAEAGFYAGGITAELLSDVTTGSLFGVSISTGSAGDLTVNKATLDVRPDDASRTYGFTDTNFDLIYSGFVSGDGAADLNTPVGISTAATQFSNVGGYALTANGGLDNNYDFNITGTGLLTINPFALTLQGLSGSDKVYDGTTAASPTGSPEIVLPFADDVSLSGTLSFSGEYAQKDVGTGIDISVNGLGLSGADAGNYSLNVPTLTGNITPLSVLIQGLSAVDRVYDATNAIQLTGTAGVTGVAGDDLSVSGSAVANTADRHVGVDKAVALSGLTLTGSDAGNYQIDSNLLATITPLALGVTGLSALNRVYDATVNATLSGSANAAFLGGDSVSVSGSPAATFADKNVGTAKPVSVSGYIFTGTDAGNYSVVQPQGLSADVTPADLQVTASVDDKEYDGSTNANLADAEISPLGSDVVVLAGSATSSFVDENAGEGKAVNVSGFALSGVDAGNYNLLQPTGVTATITPRMISIDDVTATDRAYDATTDIQVSGTPSAGRLVGGDVVTVDFSGATFALADKNAGENRSVTISGVVISGADASNYQVPTDDALTATITPAELTITDAAAADRTYDATTEITVTGSNLDGILITDLVNLVATEVAGTIANKNVGSNLPVTVSSFALTGVDSGNYSLTQPSGLTATVSAADLAITGLSGDKTYDATTAAALSASGFDAVFAGDAVTLDTSSVTSSYADKNAGVNKPITLGGLFALAGADAANYNLTQPTSLSGTISPLGITVSGLTIADKTYDGTTDGQISGTGSFGGLIAGDDIEIDVSVVGISFADKNVGTDKAVTLSGITLTGADAGNYSAETPVGITGNILAREISVTGLTTQDRVYDQTDVAQVSGTAALQGTIAGDTVGIDASLLAGSFDDKHVGVDKLVTFGGLSLTGTDAGNYTFADPTDLATISPLELAVAGLNALNRIYDTTTNALLSGTASIDPIAGDDVDLSGTVAGQYADKNVGVAKPVSLSGLSLVGADAANYSLTLPTNLSADIEQAFITVIDAIVADKIYDATTVGQLSNQGRVQALGQDELILGGSPTATFGDKDVGADKSLTIGGYTLGGSDAANYAFAQPTGLTASITPATLALTGITADDRIYDGTTVAPLSGTLSLAPLGNDVVSVAGVPVASFASRNIGENKAVSIEGLGLAGADAANYELSLPALFASVAARALTVESLIALDKVYDGNREATFEQTFSFSNAVQGDDLDLDLSLVSASFEDRNAGDEKLVTFEGDALLGNDAGNYELFYESGLRAAISTRELSVIGADAEDRAYDQTIDVAVSGGELGNLVEGDLVTLSDLDAAGQLTDKSAGLERAVAVDGYAISGDDAGNYSLTQPTDVTVDIAQAVLDVNGLEVPDRFIDGTADAAFSGGTLAGVLSGDDVGLDTSGASASFEDSDVGQDKPVSLEGLVLTGADAENYIIEQPIALTGNVLATLETITDVVPVEVLQAGAEATREAQRQELAEIAAAEDDAFSAPVNLDAINNDAIGSSLAPPSVPEILTSGVGSQAVTSFVFAADNAKKAHAAYAQASEQLRTQSKTFRETVQRYNTAVREAQVAEGLRETLQAQRTVIDAELQTVAQNLSTMAVAKTRIAELRAEMKEAERLGRGASVAEMEAMIQELEAVLEQEDELLERQEGLLAELADSIERIDENEKVIADAASLKSQVQNQERGLDSSRKAVASKRSDAQKALAQMEEERAEAEAELATALAMREDTVKRVKGDTGPSLEDQVEQVMESNARSVALNESRQAQVNEVRAEKNAQIRAWDSLEREIGEQRAVRDNASYEARNAADQNRQKVAGLSTEEIEALDPTELGISDSHLLPSYSDEYNAVVEAGFELEDTLKEVGTVRLGIADIPLKLPETAASRYDTKPGDVDDPIAFDTNTEIALKAELNYYGVLPKFQNKALADLPVASQLKLNDAMKAAAAREQQLIAQGMDPNQAALEAIDDKVAEIVVMGLAEKFDTYGITDIPGTQEFLGAAIGELAAQYGISTEPLVKTLAGDPSFVMGAPEAAFDSMTNTAQKIVENPVGAGVEVLTDGVGAVGAAFEEGGKAFVNAFTGGGGGGESAAQRQQREQQAFEARRDQLTKLGGALVGLETRRLEAVAKRDENLQAAKDIMVASSKGKDLADQRSAMGRELGTFSREKLVEQRDEAVAEVTEQVRREQVTEDLAPKFEKQTAERAAELARVEELRDATAERLAVIKELSNSSN